MRKTLIAIAIVTLVALVAGPATAGGRGGNGGNGGKGGGGSTASGSFSLLLLNSSDGAAHHGQDVTFEVTSNAYHPTVTLTCFPPEGGDWLTNQTVGFYPGWPWSQIFPLSSWKWTSGSADCSAVLYYTDRKGSKHTLDTLSFHVYA